VPTLNEAPSLTTLCDELTSVLCELEIPFEIILIDDGSTDDTESIAREICQSDKRIRYAKFRRNFGKAAALSEGFRRATGDVVVTIDGDLQDDPKEIGKLLDTLDEGSDLVSGWKWPRKDPLNKRLPSKLFNWAIRRGTGLDLHDVNSGFKAYRREMAESLSIYGSMHRYIPVLASAAGFRVSEVKVSHRPRKFGRSKYATGRFIRGFLDFLTVLFLTKYRNRPLHLIGGVGLIFMAFGLGVLTYLTVGWFLGEPIAGRPLFFLGILTVIVAVQLITFGLLAEMVTSFFLERHNDYPVVVEIGFEGDEVD
jgi:glycosyltransferase involved in cell wall biosynthesis